MDLVLSLFPGIDLLGRAFEASGFSVVRGADMILDQAIEQSHYPPGKFDGIIGGPPCQNYSDANRHRDRAEGDRLVRHFLRIVSETLPSWFLMENVRNVPNIEIPPYFVQRLHLTDHECGGKQRRLRAIQFGTLDGSIIRPLRTNRSRPVTPAVLCRMTNKHDRHSRRLTNQGAPRLPLRALTSQARARALGNAVPYKMALSLAQAVASRAPATHQDCPCRCGRVTRRGTQATASCRKRMERQRKKQYRVLRIEPT
jgi:DNA (cytosine-5)-methyltransferase 1